MQKRKLLLILKDKQIRTKILFTLFCLAVFRLLANIPVPGVDTAKLKMLFLQNQFLGLLNLFVGGALSNLSIVMLGVGPYITATIILQLLTMIFPSLEKMYKEEGEEGRQKFNQYARILTVPLSLLEGYGMLNLFKHQGIITFSSNTYFLLALLVATTGSVLLMWLGELISEKGIGNGISLLILAGILARSPVEFRSLLLKWDIANLPSYLLFFAFSLLIITGVVIINEAKRNIPISYTKRVRGNKMYGGVSTYLPLNINPAGVIPVIFALSLLMFPAMMANFLTVSNNQKLIDISKNVVQFLQNQWVHGILFFILVFGFTFFYTVVTFEPKTISENLQKVGGFIPGVRPGEQTAVFLEKILNNTLYIGATSLGIIAILPSIVQGITKITEFQFLTGGTSLLIIVSVVLETWRSLESEIEMKEYE
ncbi:MAG: preprotein translocase subunit SecY [Minisyncoccia bacterium]